MKYEYRATQRTPHKGGELYVDPHPFMARFVYRSLSKARQRRQEYHESGRRGIRVVRIERREVGPWKVIERFPDA